MTDLWIWSNQDACHVNFGPVKISVRRTIFFDKIGPAGRNFLWKNGPGRKKRSEFVRLSVPRAPATLEQLPTLKLV